MLTLEAEFSPGMRLAEAAELARLVDESGFDRLGETVTAFAEILRAVKQLS